MATLRCTAPFAAFTDGVPRVVGAGELVDSNDPIVKGREEMFEPVDTYMARRGGGQVETATAAPGETRTVTKRTRK